jgi:hypothetical protein
MPVFLISFPAANRSSGINVAFDSATFELDSAAFPDLPGSTKNATRACNTLLSRVQSWAEVVRNSAPPKAVKGMSVCSLEMYVLRLRVLVPKMITNGDETPTVKTMAPSPKFHRFLNLPKELRLEIWKKALGVDINVIAVREAVKRGDDLARPEFLPRFCYTSHATFEETVATTIESSQMMVCSYADNQFLRSFLEAVPSRFRLVRHLNFDFFSRFKEEFEVNADLELAFECKGLRTIKLNFHCNNLTYWVLEGDYDDGLTRYPAEAKDLFAKYKLARILDCDALSNIIVEYSGSICEAAVEAAKALGELLVQKSADKAARQTVELVCTRQPARPRPFWLRL